MTLSIIIVHYKTPQLLKKCVTSIFTQIFGVDFEVIVIDNDSQDNSEELIKQDFKNVVWLNNKYNAGFARANNQGIRIARGEYILLLNPDSYIEGDFIKKILCCYKKNDEDGNLGLLGCRIISSIDGHLLTGSGIGFPNFKKHIKANPIYIFITRHLFSKNNKYQPQVMHYKNHEIDFVSGACVMIKKSKIVEHNLYLDEDFFLYSEDVEWSYRIKKHGFRNYFCGTLEIFHVNSASTGFSNAKNAQMQISEYLYYFKVLSKVSFYLIGCIIQLNFLLTKTLLRRKKEIEKLIIIENEYRIFKKYFTTIPKIYKKRISGGQSYMIYAS